MENFEAFWKGLVDELLRLSHSHQLAFAASCCERAYPSYVAFNRNEGWGDPAPLRRALYHVWSIVDGQPVRADEVSVLREQCQSVIPDSDDFGSMEATAGPEAGFSIMILLEYCTDPNPRHAVRISTFARDTIDMAVQLRRELNPDDRDLEQKILRDPLMQREFNKQEQDIAQLKGHPVLDDGFVARFRAEATDGGQSNTGLR